jgi:signal transduction histidine kinase
VFSENPARVSFTILPPFWRRWWFVVLAACVVGLLIYLVYLYRVRQLLRVERLRTRIATDLHDDIGASLTRIALFSDIAKDEARQSAPKLTDVAERIGNDARELLEAVSTLVWSIDPRHDSFDDVLTYMKEFAQEMFDMKGITCQFLSDSALVSLELPVEVRRNLLLLYKEAVNNVVQHSGCTESRVEVTSRNGELLLSITDNGKGFSEGGVRGGHGLSNMRARAAAAGAMVSISSGEGTGTHVEVRIPLR